ncbi:MAG: Eco57I restriction-modification methylase domain-containing protein [Ignavibacteriales bacterium]|nr:Eco57I restriction-modification methylase domain-containing protein [Ignavibacteriales bacterium]
MDFNLKTGNTLVGFGTKQEIDTLSSLLVDDKEREEIYTECDKISRIFENFKDAQLSHGETNLLKKEIKERIDKLNNRLDVLLYTAHYGGGVFSQWHSSHQPFHWFAEFYGIFDSSGGFDVVVGNPPYVVYTPKNFSYKVKGYKTLKCGNLFAYCAERSYLLMNKFGQFGFIVPNSVVSADKMTEIQQLVIHNKKVWFSHFSWRPAKLFDGAEMRVTIIISSPFGRGRALSTKYQKWYKDFRPYLFEMISYVDVTPYILIGSIPKIPQTSVTSLIDKLNLHGNTQVNHLFLNYQTDFKFYYFRAVQYWVKILDSEPISLDDGVKAITSEMKEVYVLNDETRYFLIALLSSSLYFMHYTIYSSCQVINSRDFNFPCPISNPQDSIISEISDLGLKLMHDYNSNSKILERHYSKKGREFMMEKQHFYIKKSKEIIDEIDIRLAELFNLTQAEQDCVINYDQKFRMNDQEDSEG